jgi:TRAP-type C4-dicarboxylate transport system permease small subunit
MKRAIFLATAALLAMLILMPIAGAQETMMTVMEDTMVAGSPSPDIPASGGPAILLPAAALLLGSGILTYAILRRR